MSKETANKILRDIDIFCAEFDIDQKTFLNWIKYPSLRERLLEGKRVKPITIERVYSEMELRRFQIEIKECTSIRQAVQAATKFLEGRNLELS